MDVTRTAIVNIKKRRLEKSDAIQIAKQYNGRLCSLRYCGNHMECSYGFGVYVNDNLINYNTGEYYWI